VRETTEKSQLLKGVLDLLVLVALSNADGYGYDVVRRLRDGGLQEIAEASVYGTLRRLFSDGLLSSYVVPSDEGPHRKYYAITQRGSQHLDRLTMNWQEFSGAVEQILVSQSDAHNKEEK
jgi:PadR family transcriptional regulator PadR